MKDVATGQNPLDGWEGGVNRVPYWVFSDEDVFRAEQQKLFRGKSWNYLCLEAEIPNPGDYVATFVGTTPVIVVRDFDGQIYSFENRCAHRGSLLALDDRGTTRDFTCVYHAWRHTLQGDLVGVAFEEGMYGTGGMAEGFCKSDHGPRKLRVAELYGLVFGSFDEDIDDIEEYLGDEITGRVKRVLDGRDCVVLGRFTQILPNNWKLYVENTKDSYHASILHLFFTTFELNKLSMKGGILVSPDGGSHVSYSAVDREAEQSKAYQEQQLRSQSDYQLADESLLENFKEFDDDITLQILSAFPNFVLQQIQNCIAVRQILPKGPDKTELKWTYVGFADDTDQQRRVRLKQSNLVGPAGYVSMEDGCIGGFVQRGIAGAEDKEAILEMGGTDFGNSGNRITEGSIRGFWSAYRERMET
ncbi:aromatic ring-hydroxylating dioxygenase subunit alpha [Anianabacter salinae]|uniref:aromatic ring-hydroxylating dioxygenase subunit alpha n=1 Tax=Anianabacter salinae TaxID=2851023 RepID=UPI00225E55B5|nr:aromatic ring-hydroxylating dioxygenase subunit alpha [Anianabacter salinae]MBV0913828.1 aromatic ring-hydroxylating dioxygenase subunit alpha [Anianabacter salinae]